MRRVEVLPYDGHWRLLFEDEATSLHRILGDGCIEIHHIGSTSVPGLPAKPVIDLMPVVKELSFVDERDAAFMEAGYSPRGENGIFGRRYFHKGGDNRTHHVHIYQVGHPDIERHLAFRDYLRAHPDMAHQYGTLKTRLAAQFPYDIESYVNGKASLVLEIERVALQWYRSGGN